MTKSALEERQQWSFNSRDFINSVGTGIIVGAATGAAGYGVGRGFSRLQDWSGGDASATAGQTWENFVASHDEFEYSFFTEEYDAFMKPQLGETLTPVGSTVLKILKYAPIDIAGEMIREAWESQHGPISGTSGTTMGSDGGTAGYSYYLP